MHFSHLLFSSLFFCAVICPNRKWQQQAACLSLSSSSVSFFPFLATYLPASLPGPFLRGSFRSRVRSGILCLSLVFLVYYTLALFGMITGPGMSGSNSGDSSSNLGSSVEEDLEKLLESLENNKDFLKETVELARQQQERGAASGTNRKVMTPDDLLQEMASKVEELEQKLKIAQG